MENLTLDKSRRFQIINQAAINKDIEMGSIDERHTVFTHDF